jgi:uncharacterized protein HemY
MKQRQSSKPKPITSPPPSNSSWRLGILIAFLLSLSLYAWNLSSYRHSIKKIESLLSNFENAQALEQINLLQKSSGDSATLRLLQARALRQSDNHSAFLQQIEKSKQLGDHFAKLESEMLLEQAQTGSLKDPLAAISAWLESHPEEFESGAHALVLGLLKQQKFDLALSFLNVWNTQNPNSPWPPLFRAMLHISKREWKLAIDQLEPNLSSHPNFVPNYLQAATAYDGLQDFNKAEQALARYLQSVPNDQDAWLKYSEALRKLGRADVALHELQLNVPAQERSPSLQLQFAKLLLDNDASEQAIESLSPLAKIWPEDIEIASTMSQAFQRLGDQNQSQYFATIADQGQKDTQNIDRLLFELLSNPNRSAEDCYKLGHLLLHKQSRENGLYWLGAALQIDPNFQPALQDIALYQQRAKIPFIPSNSTPKPATPRSPAEPLNRNATSQPSETTSQFLFSELEIELPNSQFRDGSESNLFSLVETTGGGAALFDYDSDGQLDLLTAGGGWIDTANKILPGHQGALFRHLGNFNFTPSTSQARIDLSKSYHSAILAADYDNDGFTDFLATGYHGLQWFHNQGDGTFESIEMTDDQAWSSAAAFVDLDSDGDLDLYVVHYANWSPDNNPTCPSQTDPNRRDYCGPSDFLGIPDSVYENSGDGKFLLRSPEGIPNQALRGLGVLAADLDGDRKTDLYVTNDVEPNLLYHNQAPFQWTELGRRAGVATNDQGRAEGSMGIALGDYNNDAKFDLWVTNYADEFCALYRGTGPMTFSYASNATRIPATDEQAVSWGTAMHDLDLDGDEDILVINGHLERYATYHDQRPQLLENHQGSRFSLAALHSPFFQKPIAGRGLATGDFNRDGLIDLAVTRIGQPVALVRNDSRSPANNPNGFLRVRLVGYNSNRDAIGTVAKLTIHDRTWIRQATSGASYASTCENILHFGIPNHYTNKPASLEVLWPSGQNSLIPIDRLNHEVLVIEPPQP